MAGFGFDLRANPVQWTALALAWLAGLLLAEPRLWRDLRLLAPPLGRIDSRCAAILPATIVVGLWFFFRPPLGPVFVVPTVIGLGLVFRRLMAQGLRVDRRATPEGQRLLILLLLASFLMQPYATTKLVGGGDAAHYARQLYDFVTQLHEGQFPVYVGQSLSALAGSVHPLRTAPYFQYVGGLLDVITGVTLSPAALQNLLIVASFLAAVMGCYAALCAIAPTRRWECLWLSLLYGTSPGILALIYGGDMMATWLTLPWLPWLFLGWVDAWRTQLGGRGLLLQAVALAFLWLAHAPIALWASLITLAAELARLIHGRLASAILLRQAAAAILCLLLCHYVFFSVATLEVPANPYLEFDLARGVVFQVLTDTWHGWLRLVSPDGSDLMHDLHLSPGLLLVAVGGMTAAWRIRGVAVMLAVISLALGVLLMPWPGVTGRFWAAMPSFVMTVTEKWPAQRFYPLLSAMLPFLGALALAHPWLSSPRVRRGILMVLATVVGWSVWEARKFVGHGQAIARSSEATTRFFLPENNTGSRYSYEMWGYLPKYFTFGYMDPEVQNRLIDPTYGRVLDSNSLALLRAAPAGSFHRFIPTSEGGYFTPAIELEPGKACFLNFDFQGWEPSGTLLVEGKRLARRYELPTSGGLGAFGAQPGRTPGFTLRNYGTATEQVKIRFVQNTRSVSAARASITVLPYDGTALPFHLRSLQPFELEATTTGGWIETPRIFIPGYRVTVDDKPAEFRRSPNGLLMARVDEGTRRLKIIYEAPARLAVSFWLNLVAVLAAGTALLITGLAPASFRSRTIHLLEKWRPPRHGWGALALVSMAGLALTVALLARPAPARDDSTPANCSFTVKLPVGRHEVYETLLSWMDPQGATTSIVLFYEDNGHIRIGCRKNGVLKILTESLPASYFVPHDIRLLIGPRLTTEERPQYPGLTEEDWQKLRQTIRVYFNHELIWETDLRHQSEAGWRFAIGREIDPAPAGESAFLGQILRQPEL